MAYSPARPTPDPGASGGSTASGSSAAGPSSTAPSAVQQVVTLLQQIVKDGVPYVYGGDSMAGFDCSALVQYVFGKAGVTLPRTSEAQYGAGTAVQYDQLEPGDLIFSQWPGDDASPGHVAIYIGDGNLIEAPRPGEDVHQAALDSSYLAHVVGYRRVAAGGSSVTSTSSSSGGGGLLSWPGDIVDFFSGATDSLTKTADFFGAFFQPSTYVRIGSGVAGAVAVIGGLVFLILAAGEQ